MIESLLNGIADVIHDVYPKSEIYTDTVDQNLEPPCFYVHLIERSDRSELFEQRVAYLPFEIVYIPTENNKNIENNDVMHTLMMALEVVNVAYGGINKRLRGLSISGRVEDNILHVFVDYRVTLVKIKPIVDRMNEIEIKGEVNGNK